MNTERRIATESERIATGTSIARVQREDAERALRNGVPPSAWTKGALRLSNIRRRVWSRIH